MDNKLANLSLELAESLSSRQLRLCLAESCTGGMLSGILTEIPGSSTWFDRAFITYSNDSKQIMLGVSKDSLEQYGAVSEQIAQEMASGALANSLADISLSITGIAGPSGGSKDKPVGTVFFALSSKNNELVQGQLFAGERQSIRLQSCQFAIEQLLNFIEKTST